MSSNLYPLFIKGINRHFLLELMTYNPKWKSIFHVGATDERYIWHQGWQGYPLPQFRVPGEPIAQSQFAPSFNKQYIIRSFGLGDSFPQEDIDDDLYAVITFSAAKKGGLMARSFVNLMEYDTAGFFQNQGYVSGSSVAGMSDGKSLFNTAHPISANNTGTTASNRPSIDADMSVALAQFYAVNLRTQKAPDNLTFIDNEVRAVVFNPTLHYVVRQVYRGQWVPNTADRDLNYLPEDGVEFIEWAYFQSSGLTGTNNSTFVVGREHYLYFFMRSAYNTKTDYDIHTNSQIVTAMARYDEGASDWRGTSGSLGL